MFDLSSVDKALFDWFKSNAGLSGLEGIILQEKAFQFAGMLGFTEEFQKKIDTSWINRFKERHSIVAKRIHAESASVPLELVCQWKEIILPTIMQEYELGNIFNVDETGLFWKLFPDRTLQFKGIDCKGGKRAKDRITVFVGASAMGEKLPLMVIGKSTKPRCFRNATIPLEYHSNSKAWMTSELFINFIRKFDSRITVAKRKIVVIVDNCPSHPRIEHLENIKLVFLPPNTTALRNLWMQV